MVGVTLPREERGQRGCAGGEGGEDRRVGPAPLGRLDQGPHERGQRRDREDRAGDVEPRALGVARVGDEQEGAGEAQQDRQAG